MKYSKDRIKIRNKDQNKCFHLSDIPGTSNQHIHTMIADSNKIKVDNLSNGVCTSIKIQNTAMCCGNVCTYSYIRTYPQNLYNEETSMRL